MPPYTSAVIIPPLKPYQMHVWQGHLDIGPEEQKKYMGVLSKDEKEKASKFRFSKDRIAYIASRGMLRVLSGHYLNCPPEDIIFEYEAHGKPGYAHKTSLKFNVSHSGNMVIIGFLFDQVMGIDIEIIKDDFDVLDIGRNFFSKKEIAALNAIPKAMQHIAFYRCWTRKEAFIKAMGDGLSFPLDLFALSIDSDTTTSLLETSWDPKEKDQWELYSYIPADQYRAAIAIRGKINSLMINQWKHI